MSQPGRSRATERCAQRQGMSPGARDLFDESLETATDWRGTCSVCGVKLTGTIAELMKHQHAPTEAKVG